MNKLYVNVITWRMNKLYAITWRMSQLYDIIWRMSNLYVITWRMNKLYVIMTTRLFREENPSCYEQAKPPPLLWIKNKIKFLNVFFLTDFPSYSIKLAHSPSYSIKSLFL
jgi:hypothetical protein